MKAGKIVLAGIVSTSVMTLYSYVVSHYRRKNFKEPVLLAALSEDALPLQLKNFSLPVGWALHNTVGIIWLISHEFIYRNVEPTVKRGLVLGGASGVFGIIVWDAVLRLHPKPPKVEKRGFFGQLLIAHIIFGTSATSMIKKYR
jgi:hypothetical protein